MKKYFILALVLAIFVVTPAMAQVTLSGTFRLGAMWDLQDNNYLARFDRARLVARSNVDDFNAVRFELRGVRNRAGSGTLPSGTDLPGSLSGDPHEDLGETTNPGASNNLVYVHTATVTTNWAKYFGFQDTVGLTTTAGYNGFGTFDKLSYTIWDIGGQELSTVRDFGASINFDIQGIVKPYFATGFAAYDGNPSFIAGLGVDLAKVIDPVDVWLEAFMIQSGSRTDPDGEDMYRRAIGVELQVAGKIDDNMSYKVGGVLDMRNSPYPSRHWGAPRQAGFKNEFETLFKVLAGFNAFGADLGVAFLGGVNDDAASQLWFPMGSVGISVAYDITKYLGVFAGTKIAFGDYSEKCADNESFLGAEFGVYAKPGKVRYDLGYVVLNDKIKTYSAYASDTCGLGNTGPQGNGSNSRIGGWKGGLMFTTTASF